MVVLATLGVGTEAQASALSLVETILSAVALLAGVALFIRYLADPLVERLARSPELLVSFAIGWAAFLAAVGDYLGFGKELGGLRSEEHTSELQSLMRISYAVFCLKKTKISEH